jgi:hypothetical protein
MPPVPEDTDARFRGIIEQYRRAREWRRAGQPPPLSEIRDPMLALMGRASPQSRARRFFHQMMAEQAAIAGHREGVIEFVEAAVQDGLLDLAWMNRLRLLDPIRTDAKFEELRQRVSSRAERVAVAWRGPEESLDEALASLH